MSESLPFLSVADPDAHALAPVPADPLLRLARLLDPALSTVEARYGVRPIRTDQAESPNGPPTSLTAAPPPAAPPTPSPRPADLAASVPSWQAIGQDHPGWRWLRTTYGLDDTDLDLVLLALAPEIDPGYWRLYGLLLDQVGPSRPSAGLLLNLLGGSPAERQAGQARFRAGSRLVAGRILAVVAPTDPLTPRLAHPVVLDPQIVDVLLQQGGLDDRLVAWCTLAHAPDPAPRDPAALALPPQEWAAVAAATLRAWSTRTTLRLGFSGSVGSGRGAAALTLAGSLGVPLLRATLAKAPGGGIDLATWLPLVLREATLHGALPYLDATDLPEESHAELSAGLARHDGVVVVATRLQLAPVDDVATGVVDVSFAAPPFTARRLAWRHALRSTRSGSSDAPYDAEHADLSDARADEPADARSDELADELADRFRFGPGPIQATVASATSAARLREARTPRAVDEPVAPSRTELFRAARHQVAGRLADLARRVEDAHDWSRLVLSDDAEAQLREVCARVTEARTVWDDWGFDPARRGRRGVSALFAGPPGTGKTMAACVVARELGVDMFAVDLSSVVSKYIGETEKNLERLFTVADGTGAVLFFDEADALFGKRTKVQDAHDRYANIEVSYLLQRMDSYDGVAVLATNLRENLDEAFARRLDHIVEFGLPDAALRRRLWVVALPPGAPLAADVDLDALAERYPLTGANIRNVAVDAAFRAAHDRVPIGRVHLGESIRREYQKLGRVLRPDGPEGS